MPCESEQRKEVNKIVSECDCGSFDNITFNMLPPKPKFELEIINYPNCGEAFSFITSDPEVFRKILTAIDLIPKNENKNILTPVTSPQGGESTLGPSASDLTGLE